MNLDAKEKERKRNNECIFVCVCVCMREQDRKQGRKKERKGENVARKAFYQICESYRFSMMKKSGGMANK